jgi:predicted acylesterase/phospholipase RssA
VRALVLSGGGALGAYEAGVISILCETFDYDLVCGTSIGALNAAFVAQNRLGDLREVWATISEAKVITLDPLAQRIRDFALAVMNFQKDSGMLQKAVALAGLYPAYRRIGPMSAVLSMLGGLSPDPIAAVLAKYLDFGRLARSIVVSGTNLTTGASDAFCWFADAASGARFAAVHDKGLTHPLSEQNFRGAVRASSAIPFAFAPVLVSSGGDSLAFVDGGVANNTPLGVAIDAGATEVTVVFLNPVDRHTTQAVANLAEVGLTCFSIMQERILELDFKDAQRVNDDIAKNAGGSGSAGTPRRPVDLKFIRPATTLPITVLQFDRQDLVEKVYAMGIADAQAAVRTWQT